MARKKTSITIEDELLYKASTMAVSQNRNRNDIISEALDVFFKLQGLQMWEKQISDNQIQMVSIYDNRMCLDYITKRVHINATSDIEKLLEDGYYQVFQI
jgi:hypothetical protein